MKFKLSIFPSRMMYFLFLWQYHLLCVYCNMQEKNLFKLFLLVIIFFWISSFSKIYYCFVNFSIATSGLDASYPWAQSPSSSEFLDASDAKLVVNMRTSPVGSRSPPGHIDFYAHDGLLQPGCDKWYFPNASECSSYMEILFVNLSFIEKDVFFFLMYVRFCMCCMVGFFCILDIFKSMENICRKFPFSFSAEYFFF